jgi:hypothetical protein
MLVGALVADKAAWQSHIKVIAAMVGPNLAMLQCCQLG